jgi:ubiquinone/menaquinone biosynthesis C-methylase UbiE
MAEQQIRFDDGAAYERMMGVWSRLAGSIFLDWLSPASGLRWIDIGCGTGVFTELLVERRAPTAVLGIDPSEGQLTFARTRPAARLADFRRGDAAALPVADDSFDAAVMAPVLFFVRDPAKGVTEMVRVVRPGGTVSAYVWDMLNGGFPPEPIQDEMRAMGFSPPRPPQSAASEMAALRDLWKGADLDEIETKQITVQRTFADFDDYWSTSLLGSTVGPTVAAMSSEEVHFMQNRLRARLLTDAAGRVTCEGRANAIKGRVSKFS